MKEIVDMFNSEIKEIRSTNRYMQNYIDSCHKESRQRALHISKMLQTLLLMVIV